MRDMIESLAASVEKITGEALRPLPTLKPITVQIRQLTGLEPDELRYAEEYRRLHPEEFCEPERRSRTFPGPNPDGEPDPYEYDDYDERMDDDEE